MGCIYSENSYGKVDDNEKSMMSVYNHMTNVIEVNNNPISGMSYKEIEYNRDTDIWIKENDGLFRFRLKPGMTECFLECYTCNIIAKRVEKDNVYKLYVGIHWRTTGIINNTSKELRVKRIETNETIGILKSGSSEIYKDAYVVTPELKIIHFKPDHEKEHNVKDDFNVGNFSVKYEGFNSYTSMVTYRIEDVKPKPMV